MKLTGKLALVCYSLLAINLASAQEEQATRGTSSASDRYWTAPRVQADPASAFTAPKTEAIATNLVIENETLRVTWTGKGLTIVHKPSGAAFLEGDFNVTGGAGKIAPFERPALGKGQGIEIVNPDGTTDRVMLFSNLPFVLYRTVLVNSNASPAIVKFVRPFNAAVHLDKPASGLKLLGSAGLTTPEKNPGSYDWLAVADPQTRHGVVFGWLTSERGCGVLFDKVVGDTVRVGAQIDYGRLTMPGKKREFLEELAIGYFDDARLGLEAYADTIAKELEIHLPPQPTVYCTWYSQPYGGSADEKHFAENATFAKEHLGPFGFSVAQIDDGWQAGFKRPSPRSPKKDFTTHNPEGDYPSGMKATADKIKGLGVKPGIWFMPFAGTAVDPVFTNHLDWFAKSPDGIPYETSWGGTCFDLTYAPTRKYVHDVVDRICNEWGYQYIKIDGLWTGSATKQLYVNSGYKEDDIGEAVFHDPNISNVEAYRSGLRLVRETAGKDVFILGCNTPQNMRVYGASMGFVDGMRVGPDNKAEWTPMTRGPTYGTRNYFLNGRVWYNDPDPVYVRNGVPLNEARLLCSWVAISGAMNTSSEWYSGLPPERLDLLKRTMPAHGLLSVRPVDLFENDLPRLWLLQAMTSPAVSGNIANVTRNIVGVFNWEDEESQFSYSVGKLGLDANLEYIAFDYWQDKLLPPVKGDLKINLERHSCAVLAMRPSVDHPQVISTSRHITQGVVDLVWEKWDPETKTLSGRSKVVGGDPYELRIATGLAGAPVQLSEDDQKAGVKATVGSPADGLVRVKLESPDNREIVWSIKFQ